MKSKTILFTLLVAIFSFQACRDAGKTNGDSTPPNSESGNAVQTVTADTAVSQVSPETDNFYYKAIVFGMVQIAAGKLAINQGTDSKVKRLGDAMIKDYRKANAELKKIAMANNIELPLILPFKDQDRIDALEKLRGSDFDKQCIGMLLDEHRKAVELFKVSASDIESATASFSKNALSVAEGHIKKAESIKTGFAGG